ncbi:MAG: hypothetical protein QM726_04490 [Chitinophagaceae bacterium]
MDRNFYDNDDFEDFLKQKSDQYKMYPSDKVWNNIYSSLHGRKKWWALGFTLLFLGGSILVGKEVVLSNYTRVASQLNQTTEDLSSSKLSPLNHNSNNASSASSDAVAHQPYKPLNLTKAKSISIPPVVIQNLVPVSEISLDALKPAANQQDNNIGVVVVGATNTANNNEVVAANNHVGNEPAEEILFSNYERKLSASLPSLQKKNNLFASVSLKGKMPALHYIVANETANSKKENNKINQVENASARTPGKPSRLFLQLYASPTISYRRWSSVDQPGVVPVASGDGGNVNHYVNHKPATGFEIGSNIQYKLSSSLSVFVGAQLNYSRYYIDAYKYRTEKATIVLTGSSAAHDTVSGYTNIRNFSGYAPEQLQNKYLQFSVPIGLEIKLLGDKKLQFNISGGFQPTFLLSSTSYLISSDYKNYIQSPDLARTFNVHTNFEAFLSYKMGGLRWQLGPQIRSQLLSSYSNQYRVREYLTEYGIKFGVTKSF